MENVANFRQHGHFQLILEVLQWLGWSVRWETTLDLGDILPQKRDRFLMILVRQGGVDKPAFQCLSWDKRVGITLKFCDILRPRDCLSHMHVPRLTPEILRLYLHPRLIPGDDSNDSKTAKAFRLRTADQTFSCVMSQYGHAHDLGLEVIQKSGLFGNLVLDHDITRWLSIPEICNLMGLMRPWKAPLDAKITYQMLGNAIATPHALICMVNAMCLFPHVPHVQTPKAVLEEAFRSLLSGSIQEVLIDAGANEIMIGLFQVSPTLPWSVPQSDLTEWMIPVGPWLQRVLVQPGASMAVALKAIFPHARRSSITWRPQAYPDILIPLTADDVAGFGSTRFDGVFGFMRVRETDFAARKLPIMVVHLPRGVIVLKKTAETKIPDIRMQLGSTIPCGALAVDLWGFPMDQGGACPDCIAFSMPNQETPSCPYIDSVCWVAEEIGWSMRASLDILFAYLKFCRLIGLEALIQRLGWSIMIQPGSSDAQDLPQLLFRPRVVVPSVDGKSFRTICTTTIAQALLPPQIPTRGEIIAQLKMWDTWTPEYTWSQHTLVRDIVEPWSRASAHTGERSEMRVLHIGRQMSNEFTLKSDLPSGEQQTVLRIHCVLQLHGGGSKLDANHQMRQNVVEFLLQAGADPLQVNGHVKMLCEKAGTARVQHAFQVHVHDERLVQLQRLATALNMRPLRIDNPDLDRSKKMRAWKPKALAQQTPVKACDFQLLEGHFSLADGTPMHPISWQTKDPVEVLLLDAESYHDFARSLSQQPHALGVAVLGHECPVMDSSCYKLHVAARDNQGVQVILKTCFHQLGKMQVRPITKEGDDIQVTQSKLIAVTAWKDEIPAETWASLIKSPARICAQLLSIKPQEHYGIAPWGRAFRAGSSPCSPEEACSFQYHVRLRVPILEVILKRSGQEGVYVVPKSETLNRAHEQFAIVWLGDRTLAQAKEFLTELDCHLGLARASSESVHYGIRVYADVFESVFKKAFPLKPVPSHLVTHYLAKVSPVPVGATHENMKEWLESQNVKGKPIRALNATPWLLSTVDRMARQFLTWGHDAVILTPVQSWQEQGRPTVLAGKQFRPANSKVDPDPEDDWLQLNDPWAGWGSSSSSSAASNSSTRESRGSQPSTQVQIQISAQKKEIDHIQARLKSLEDKADISESNNQAWKTTVTKDPQGF